MKRLLCMALLLMLTCLPLSAGDIVDTAPLKESLGEDAGDILKDYNIEDGNVKSGFTAITDRFIGALREQLRKSGGSAFLVLIICAAISLAETFSKANGINISAQVLDIFALCALMVISLGTVNSVLHRCTGAIDGLSSFWKVLFPIFATATAVAGSPATAVSSAGAMLLFSGVLIDIAGKLIIPAVFVYIGAGAAAAVTQNSLLSAVAGLIKWCSITFYKCFLTFFTVYLSLSGIISGSADAAAVRTAQATITGVIPVLGGTLAETSNAILSGAAVLKGAVGIYGFLAACAICLTPFVMAFAHFLVYRILGAVSSSLAGGAVGRIITVISDGYAMALGLLGTCCAVQFISIVVSSMVVGR